jgi:hypothetical protein
MNDVTGYLLYSIYRGHEMLQKNALADIRNVHTLCNNVKKLQNPDLFLNLYSNCPSYKYIGCIEVLPWPIIYLQWYWPGLACIGLKWEKTNCNDLKVSIWPPGGGRGGGGNGLCKLRLDFALFSFPPLKGFLPLLPPPSTLVAWTSQSNDLYRGITE